MTDISSSEDEFPDIEVVIQKRKQKPTVKDLDGDKENMQASLDDCVNKTPVTMRRRRKLGQAQSVGGSLLKPWRQGLEVGNETNATHTPASRQSSWTKNGSEDTSNLSMGDLLDRLPSKAKHAEPGRVLGAIKFANPPQEAKVTRRLISRAQIKALKSSAGLVETDDESEASSSSEYESASEDLGTLGRRIDDNDHDDDEDDDDDDGDSDFSLSSSDSELAIIPPPRSQVPISPRRAPRRILSTSRDPSKKQPARTESTQDDATKGTKKRPEKQLSPKKPTAATTKARRAPKGNLEDDFSKLKIFDEESDDDRTYTLNTTTPRKIIPPSPTKRTRIPASPWKPEHKQFWDPGETFSWIDQHSPPKSSSGNKAPVIDLTKDDDDDEDDDDGDSSSRAALERKYGMSPEKKQARKAFEACKRELAREFLQELDAVITGGKLGEMTESTGGLRIVWLNTLLTTAGRAQWRQTTRHPSNNVSPSNNNNNVPPSSSSSSTTNTTATTNTSSTSQRGAIVEHHSHIELATKVLSDESALLNTVAHEFCHLAVFMLHGRVKSAHGSEFKSFGERVMMAASRTGGNGLKTPRAHGVDINITTRHNYKIDYRFVWRCAGCAGEVCRHSRSVNPARHRCGRCRTGVLVQVKPVPRKTKSDGDDNNNNNSSVHAAMKNNDDDDDKKKKKVVVAGGGERKRTAYQEFTAREMKALSVSHKGVSFKDKMAIVSARWAEHRDMKEKKKNETETEKAQTSALTLAIRSLRVKD